MGAAISEKEFAVISELSNNHSPNQRIIAWKLGISLGLTNLIINRLARTGYIKIKQLNHRNIQYFLTPKGFSEKAKKSYNYTLKTISVLKLIREKIQSLVMERYKSGAKNFLIVGDNELADLTEIAIKKLSIPDVKYSRAVKIEKIANNTVIFYTVKNKTTENSVDLISHLANSGLNV
ncbi:MAG: winged helix-turn-helix transcriptional regulator [Elusimicrobia bacterium]|nr:winged helix-turn-helix transcriptional regulator [Elusimicrobiota bacterium]